MERLNTQEAMDFIGCSYSKLYRLVKSGQLDGTYFNIGNRRIFFKDRLLEWMLNGGEKKETESTEECEK